VFRRPIGTADTIQTSLICSGRPPHASRTAPIRNSPPKGLSPTWTWQCMRGCITHMGSRPGTHHNGTLGVRPNHHQPRKPTPFGSWILQEFSTRDHWRWDLELENRVRISWKAFNSCDFLKSVLARP